MISTCYSNAFVSTISLKTCVFSRTKSSVWHRKMMVSTKKNIPFLSAFLDTLSIVHKKMHSFLLCIKYLGLFLRLVYGATISAFWIRHQIRDYSYFSKNWALYPRISQNPKENNWVKFPNFCENSYWERWCMFLNKNGSGNSSTALQRVCNFKFLLLSIYVSGYIFIGETIADWINSFLVFVLEFCFLNWSF